MHLYEPLDNLSLGDRRDARTYSLSMLLEGAPSSPEGNALVEDLVGNVISPVQSAKGQLRPTQVAKYRKVTGAFLADLLNAARLGRWSKKATSNKALETVTGGAAAFRTMRTALLLAGHLEELKGFKKEKRADRLVQHNQTATTSFRPTAKLLKLAEDHGVLLTEMDDHFLLRDTRKLPAADVLELRQSGADQTKVKVSIGPDDQTAARITADLGRLNAYLMEPGRVSGITFAGLRRLFHKPAAPGRTWRLHGRYYSMPGADAYERMEGGRAARTRIIRLDGAEVATLDISGSHLTIMHGLLGVPFAPGSDPYDFPGLSRDLVKACVTHTLGASSIAVGGNRYNHVRRALLERYPFLEDLEGQGIGPLDLQYHEAEILRLAMESLMEAGVAFLPVHDELMVAKGNQEAAEGALRGAFRQYFTDVLGMATYPEPRLTVAD